MSKEPSVLWRSRAALLCALLAARVGTNYIYRHDCERCEAAVLLV